MAKPFFGFPSREALRREEGELLDQGLPRYKAHEEVGRRYGVSRTTVQMYLDPGLHERHLEQVRQARASRDSPKRPQIQTRERNTYARTVYNHLRDRYLPRAIHPGQQLTLPELRRRVYEMTGVLHREATIRRYIYDPADGNSDTNLPLVLVEHERIALKPRMH